MTGALSRFILSLLGCKKSEIRSTRSETKFKEERRKLKTPKAPPAAATALPFLSFGFLSFGFVSDCPLRGPTDRASDFGFTRAACFRCHFVTLNCCGIGYRV